MILSGGVSSQKNKIIYDRFRMGLSIGIIPNGHPPGYSVIDRWRFNPLIEYFNQKSFHAEYYNEKDFFDILIVPLRINNEIYFQKNKIGKQIKIIGDITDNIFSFPWNRYNILGKGYYFIQRHFHRYYSRLAKMVHMCDAVVVGSKGQANFFKQYSPRINIIPDAIYPPKYSALQRGKINDVIRLVWIGNVESLHGLYDIQPVLNVLDLYGGFELILITSEQSKGRILGKFPRSAREFMRCQKIKCKLIQWNISTYENEISNGDIGVVPVDMKSNFCLDKPPGRILLLMSIGIPVIASPVPSYQDILNNRETGFIAGSHQEWLDNIFALAKHPKVRYDMGKIGQNLSLTYFGKESFAKKYSGVIDSLLK